MFRMYIIRTSGNIISRKGNGASINGAVGGLSSSTGDLGVEPLRKFLGSKGHLDWLNDTQENICFTQFSTRIYRNTSLAAPDLFPMFTKSVYFCILYCHKIKAYRCLKNVIHRLEINKWLLLSAFQQGFWQKLSWAFSSNRETRFLRGFILKPTERT